jgi:hypothetical protein
VLPVDGHVLEDLLAVRARGWRLQKRKKFVQNVPIRYRALNLPLVFCRPKNLTPWRDSNPGSSVLETDATTALPRRQVTRSFLLPISHLPVFLCFKFTNYLDPTHRYRYVLMYLSCKSLVF